MKKSYKELEERQNETIKMIYIGSVVAFVVMLLTSFINGYIIHTELLITIGTISLAVAVLSNIVLVPVTMVIYMCLENKALKEEQGSN